MASDYQKRKQEERRAEMEKMREMRRNPELRKKRAARSLGSKRQPTLAKGTSQDTNNNLKKLGLVPNNKQLSKQKQQQQQPTEKKEDYKAPPLKDQLNISDEAWEKFRAEYSHRKLLNF